MPVDCREQRGVDDHRIGLARDRQRDRRLSLHIQFRSAANGDAHDRGSHIYGKTRIVTQFDAVNV